MHATLEAAMYPTANRPSRTLGRQALIQARRYAERDGDQMSGYHILGVMDSMIDDMESKGLTPSEYIRAQGWDSDATT